MPKVETSLFRGNKSKPKSVIKQNYVSNVIGQKMRYIRSTSDGDFSVVPKPRRRVVKKLIDVRPVPTSTESNEATTRRHRKRVIIKKKKKKRLLRNNSTEPVPAATKRRRKVVVTRKRLLNIVSSTVDIRETFQTTIHNNLDDDFSSENIIEDTSTDSTTTESIEDYDSTESNDFLNESTESSEDYSTEETPSDDNQLESTPKEPPYHVPDYEPFFPELSDTFDAPVLLLKTTVLSSIELLTKTIIESRLKTYTFVVTRVNGDEQIVTSSTEVRPKTKTIILTEPVTKFTTLTLLDFDATSTSIMTTSTDNPSLQMTASTTTTTTPFPESSQLKEGRAFDEARHNLATRVMSNGVEVIVAGDKSTLPGRPDIKRVLPSTIYKAVTLKPSTLTDHMMMVLPQDATDINSLNQFVTKTCLTTFTYLTTFLESGTTTVSSHEQVVSNVATEERNTGKILPTPAMGVTLTQYPNLSVGVFHTTYTYLNTILDGEQPLVVSSKHTVTNTVTAPDDYLSLLHPSINVSAIKDTNTYYSTLALQKTLYEGDTSKVISTTEVVTQVVITESVPPKATSVMTSYIAVEDPNPTSINYTTTDVIKTYYVTYTYYDTFLDNDNTVTKTHISTSSDVVTEKLYLHPRRTQIASNNEKNKQKLELDGESFHILATKTYHTTFTYFTTLLQEGNTISPTVISSHSKVVKNVATKTIDPNLLDKRELKKIKDNLKDGTDRITATATLQDGQKLEITVIADIKPTKVLPIEKTVMPQIKQTSSIVDIEPSTPSVVTGSTIIFLDDLPIQETPSLTSTSKAVKKTKTASSTSKLRRSTKTKIDANKSTSVSDKKPSSKVIKPVTNQVPDLLGLGSINIQALKPVLNVMADLIQTNLKSNRRNDSVGTTTLITTAGTTPRPLKKDDIDIQNRSPIYIPVGGLADDFEIAESQNIATFHLQETVWDKKNQKPIQEASLLNGGIPISPGDVITANSDVIVGKPGRILPRIPSIPLNQIRMDDYDLKPPPVLPPTSVPLAVPNKLWPKRNSLPSNKANKKDDYIGPPPPLVRTDMNKRIPINQYTEQNYANSHKNYVSYGVNEVVKDPIQDFNLRPSIVLPEIIERSTGQPLLVNIQPSQVAFVNIPHNRTTALVYGGSTEQHRNGQYFDDPSPYPQPEFSAIEGFSSGIPQFASIYRDGIVDQKQVGGVIKVATQPIGIEQAEDQQIQYSIKPSKPTINNDIFVNYPNHEINIKVPPISFGIIQKDNDFNAHVINHGETQFNPPPIAYDVIKNENHRYNNDGTIRIVKPSNPTNIKYGTNQDNFVVDLAPPKNYPSRPQGDLINRKPPTSNPIRHTTYPPVPQPNYRRRPKPKPSISEFMSPPPPSGTNNYIPSRRPQPIPLIPDDKPATSREPIHGGTVTFEDQVVESTGDDDDDDGDLVSEDGEVIQESNSRPLQPGQVPQEILKIHTTTEKSVITNNTIRFPYEEHIHYRPRPIVSNPRPFANNQGHQVVFNYDQLSKQTIPPEGFITFIGTTTNPPSTNRFTTTTPPTTPRPTTSRRPDIVYVGTKRLPTNRPIIRWPEIGTIVPTGQFAIKTRRPPPAYVSTTKHPNYQMISSRPKITTPNTRPKITSLPIDTQTNVPKVPEPNYSQTEKPFKPHLSITDLLNREKVTNPPPFEVSTTNRTEDLVVMKPPPPEPEIQMQPPKIEINSPSTDIQRVPNLRVDQDLETHASTHRPYVPKPVEEMLPPPPSEEVVGMNPPPLSTYKPIISEVTTSKPTTIEIKNISTIPPPTRRPFTRRPIFGTRPTRRPIWPNYEIYTKPSTPENTVTPLPTIQVIPSMEVIIGNPSIQPVTTTPKEESATSGLTKEAEFSTESLEVESTSSFVTHPGVVLETSTKEEVITPAIHHAGNEIKVVDDIVESSTSTTKTPKLTVSRETVLPTRHITHTKTSTVTITKTTVVKTLGGPPSTLTLLVTKTEKSTIIDTVTQVHTLVKPTSIVETITTTVNPGSTLYSSGVYGNYQQEIEPTKTTQVVPTITTIEITNSDDEDDDLEDFIIKDADPVPTKPEIVDENDSIFVVMTDKNKGSVIKVPNDSYETQERDEMLENNEVNNVLLSGIFAPHQPTLEVPRPQSDRCDPECKASRNELCQKVDGIMRCVCRPGFARMFPDRPCIPTYTYTLQIDLDRHRNDFLKYQQPLSNPNSTEFKELTKVTHDAIDRMVMQSDLRDIYHGVHIHSYKPNAKSGIIAKFYLQLSDNTNEQRLEDVLKKYLRNNNYSLGGTELYANRDSLNGLQAIDFDECTNTKYHDCSENAQCFNLKGTYTCSCKEGYADLSENILYPGRICSAEMIGCERCNYHGTCYSRGEDHMVCECFHWYTGDSCQINLKVLLIALVTLGALLFVLLVLCLILTCCRRKPKSKIPNGMSFFPQRVSTNNNGTIDRRAMIQDTSSEDSRSDTNVPPYVAKKKKLKGALKKTSIQHNDVENCNVNTLGSTGDQKDRSLTVMIPRAKYHPAPPTSPLSNYTSFDARKPSVPSTTNETKLLSYLDAGPTPNRTDSTNGNKRKFSHAHSDSYINEKANSRKTSGALVSAGFEVSATVMLNNMGTLGTTCGTEADRSENATLIQKISADLLSSTGTRSQFNTIRKSLVDNDLDAVEDWLDITPRINTVSEARSYDETTIPPPMKSFRNDQNDEANTMAERDLGSTFLLPHTHLYKPDRGSDISGFESL